MTIKELKKVLNRTPGAIITEIEIEFVLSNNKKEKKQLTEFNKPFHLHYECMNLYVLGWSKDNKEFANKLTVEVFESEYLTILEKFFYK